MRKINFKKISLLMIMLVAFSVFIMPTKVKAEIGKTWTINRLSGTGVDPKVYLNEGYKVMTPNYAPNRQLTWASAYLIRGESVTSAGIPVVNQGLYCVEIEKTVPAKEKISNNYREYDYNSYKAQTVKNTNLINKQKLIEQVLTVGYPTRTFEEYKSKHGTTYKLVYNGTTYDVPVTEVEYEKATQFAIWAVMEKGSLAEAKDYVLTSDFKVVDETGYFMEQQYSKPINKRIRELASVVLEDAKSVSKTSINVASNEASNKESGTNYKVFGPYKVTNNSPITKTINLLAKGNAKYDIKIMQNNYAATTNEKIEVTQGLESGKTLEFYIKVYAKEGININDSGDVSEAVTVSCNDGSKQAYFNIMAPEKGYYDYTATEGSIYFDPKTNESGTSQGAGAIDATSMQTLIYPGSISTKFEKTISLSWERSVGNITIYKKDDAGKDLAGATFTINTTTGVNWKDVVASGKFIGIKAGTTPTYSEDCKTITFVADSKIEIKDVPFGTYSVLEVESPAGYYTEIKSSDKLITLSATATNVERTFTNHKVVVDLSLEKWVNKVTGEAKSGKEIVTKYNDRNTLDNNVEGRKGDIFVCEGDIVTYTIRIFNHGNVDATATEIIDRVPEGLEFLPDDKINKLYKWYKDKDGILHTNYLASQELIQEHGKEGTAHNGLNYNSDSNKNIAPSCNECNYKDVQISFRASFKTKDGSTLKRLINVAEIAEYKSEYEDRWTVRPLDVDSKENNHPKNYDFENGDKRVKYDMLHTSTELGKYYREDDEDIAVIIPARFDLALEKWVSTVIREGEENRKYEDHNTLDNNVEERAGDIKVRKGDTVIYTIRVYNQGNIAGYATEVMDSMPEGLEFLVDNEINKQFGWEEREGKLYTTYLSDKKLEAHDGWAEHVGYNYNKGENEEKSCDKCAYEDIQVVFKVGDTVTENKQNIDRIINLAQITKHKTVIDTEECKYADIDSTPGNYETDFEEGKTREDDEDIAVIIPEKFDLALQKWITSYTKTVGDQEETITTEQNHETTIEEKNNDKLVKIDLAEKDLSKTTIKIKYAVRVENEGEIPGYVKELTDYIPAGTEFHQEDNLNEEGKPYWTMDGDKAVTAEAYEEQLNTILQPGESHLFYITLRWTNDKNNLGLKNNWVEISEDDNDWEVPDIDSDPENMLEERTPHYWEDDEDEVPFLLTIKTGESMIKYALIFIILVVTLGGALLIRRKVKNMI